VAAASAAGSIVDGASWLASNEMSEALAAGADPGALGTGVSFASADDESAGEEVPVGAMVAVAVEAGAAVVRGRTARTGELLAICKSKNKR
jgi:hypothetical protein